MADQHKPTKAIRGAQLKTQLRNIMNSESALGADARDRLVNRTMLYVTSARFRHLPPEVDGKSNKAVSGAAVKSMPAKPGAETASAEAAVAPANDAGGKSFDAYAFSVVAVLAKDGEMDLRERLNAITSGDDLRALARGQKLSLPRALLDDGSAKVADLRNAIIDAAQKRIANRQAAAG